MINKRHILFFVICFTTIATRCAAQPNISNLQFLKKLFQYAAEEGTNTIHENAAKRIVLAGTSLTGEPNQLLSDAIISDLQNRGFEVYAQQSESSDAIIINVKIVQFEFLYSKIKNSKESKQGDTKRQAKVLVDFKIHHGRTGEIYYQQLMEKTHADTIRADSIKQLEIPSMPITIASWEEKNGKRNLLEPIILAAATGAVVYAFYTLRSK